MSCAYLGNVLITEDDLDLIERLCEVDGVNGSVFIYREGMRRQLAVGGYIELNAINWAWGTPKLRARLSSLRKTFDIESSAAAREMYRGGF